MTHPEKKSYSELLKGDKVILHSGQVAVVESVEPDSVHPNFRFGKKSSTHSVTASGKVSVS